MAPVTQIPGIGKTFARDLARIGIERVEQLRGEAPEALFERLAAANAREDHATSKNYLYVLRMAVYYADGGRDADRLAWHAWTDAAIAARAPARSTQRTAPRRARATPARAVPRTPRARRDRA